MKKGVRGYLVDLKVRGGKGAMAVDEDGTVWLRLDLAGLGSSIVAMIILGSEQWRIQVIKGRLYVPLNEILAWWKRELPHLRPGSPEYETATVLLAEGLRLREVARAAGAGLCGP